mgnify:CR=1 FL=1
MLRCADERAVHAPAELLVGRGRRGGTGRGGDRLPQDGEAVDQLLDRYLEGAPLSLPVGSRVTLRVYGVPDQFRLSEAVSAQALSIATERDHDVLLVDADFAKPSVLSTLGLPGGSGLMDALVDPAIAVEDCILATDVPGLFVLPAGNPLDALAILNQNRAVALLMTDVVMPSMNGRKLADEALRVKPDLKVLFATGYTRNAIIHNGTLDEGVELIMKPYTLEALAEKIAKVLGLKAGR